MGQQLNRMQVRSYSRYVLNHLPCSNIKLNTMMAVDF
jgi:hypothetical protein